MLRIRPRLQACATAWVCTFLVTTPALAQTVTGSITGTVVDATGAILVGASVKVTNEATGVVRETKTNETGNFVRVGLPPATYSVTVDMEGFRSHVRTGIVLTPNERVSLGTVRLELGAPVETITVTAESAAVNTATAATSATLSASQLSNITIRGRDFMNLIRLAPGVAQSGGGDNPGGAYGTSSPEIGGQARRTNNLTLDGAAAADIHIREAFSAGISADAIAELKVTTNTYTSDIGTNPGGTISVITKSGTREFHGSSYYYNRHEQWNAKDFFTNRNNLPNPPYRMSVIGVTLGGPVTIPGVVNTKREKLFFFYSGEGSRNYLPASANTNFTMPTPLERAGDFSRTFDTGGKVIVIRDPAAGAPFPGNVIPPSRIHKQGQALLNVFPLPNFFDTAISGYAYNYSYNRFEDVPKQSHTLKIDYAPTGKDTFTFRPKRYDSDTRTYSNRYLSSGAPLGLYSYDYTHLDAMVNWIRTVSPTMLNEWQAHFSTARERGYPADRAAGYGPWQRSTYGITLGQKFPLNNPFDFLPGMTFGGISNPASLTWDMRAPMEPGDAVFEISDNLSYIRGPHTTKFGFYMIKLWASEGPRAINFNGLFDFGNDTNNPGNTNHPFATALVGNYRSYTEANAKNKGMTTSAVYEWFAQDEWKVNRRLTLTLGARFSKIKPYQLRKGQEGAALALQLYDPAQAPRLYYPVIVGGRRLASDLVTGQTGPPVLIGGFVPGSGNITNGAVTAADIEAGRYPRGFVNPKKVQVSPRLGFALDLFGTGRTSLRGGFGVGKHALEDSGKFYNVGVNVPYIFTPTTYYGTLDTFRAGAEMFYPSRADSFELAETVPSVYNWSFGIQQDMGSKIMLDAAYVGKVGRHLAYTYNMNVFPYGTRFLPRSQDPTLPGRALPDAFLNPFREYTAITRRSNSGTSNYNALQVQVNRPMAHGFRIGVSYTWSKAMGMSNTNPFVPARIWNYGEVSFDQTQMFVSNFFWVLPKPSSVLPNTVVRGLFDNWQLSGILTLASGTARRITITTTGGYDFSGGNAGQRVDIVGPVSSEKPTFDKWFNTGSVALPAKGTPGNAALRNFRGPGINNWELALAKKVPIREAYSLRLGVEFYNAFNHTQYDGVNATARFNSAGNQTNPLFGQVSSTRAPRVIQFSGSFQF